MFKRILVFSFIMALACSAAFANAPDRVNKLDWGIEGGGAFPGGEIESAGYIQTNLSYGMTEWIAIGIEGGWWEADTDAANGETIGVGQILGDIIFRVPTLHDQLVPYGIIGLGYAGTYMVNEPTNASQEGADTDDSSFAFKIGGGLDWFLTPNWVANFELAWTSNSPDLTGASTEDADALAVMGGIKYVF